MQSHQLYRLIIVVAILTITTEDIVIALCRYLALFAMYLPQRLLSFNKFSDSLIRHGGYVPRFDPHHYGIH